MKNIRKRHRDVLEEIRRVRDATRVEKEEMESECEDEKYHLNLIIREQNERIEHDQQMRDDYGEIQSKYSDLLASDEDKTNRIRELEEQAESLRRECETATNGKVEALKRADRGMEDRVSRIEKKHKEELEELRGANVTLQDRLNIALKLQSDLLFHKSQVGTVDKMHQNLKLLEQANKEELSAKDEEIKELDTTITQNEREIRYLKITAHADRQELENTTEVLRETREALRKAESKIARQQMEVESLNLWGKGLGDDSRSRSGENFKLKREIDTLRAAQRNELVEAQAKNEGLLVNIECLRATIERLDQELESWEKRNAGSMGVSKINCNATLPGTTADSLAKALKAANARANALQSSVDALHAENGVLQKQLGKVAQAYDPKVQEQLETRQSENRNLREAVEQAETLKTQLKAQFGEKLQNLQEGFASKTRKLEADFDQSFESLRGLRDQWLLRKRGLEQLQNRDMLAADLRHENERKGREDRFMAACKEKEKELQRKEDALVGREAEVAQHLGSAQSSGQALNEMKNRAENAEEGMRRLQDQLQRKENELQSRKAEVARQVQFVQLGCQAFNEMKTRAENAEEELQKLDDEINGIRRDLHRRSDLLNEETSKMAQESRVLELHGELQSANCSIDDFKYKVVNVRTDSEFLSQYLCGADYYESDVRLLQTHGRTVLLAQLQAAKLTLGKLRSLLSRSPQVEVDKAWSILMEPRGDENAAQSAGDIYDDWNEAQHHPSNSRKRSGVPLGPPTDGNHEDSTAYDDWGDQQVSDWTKISTPQEISNRPRHQPKSRRNRVPAGQSLQST